MAPDFSLVITFILSILLLFLILIVLRLKHWCGCHTCQAFLTSTWSSKYNNLCDWYSHLLSHSPTGTINVHVLDNVITANPDNVEYILKTNFKNYPKGKPFSTILGDLLGFGIFNVDGDLWNFQRKLACLELGSNSIRTYAFGIVQSEILSRLIPLVDQTQGSSVDLQDVFRRFSFDSICRFSFGMDPGCLDPTFPDSEFADAFDVASKLSAERAIVASALVWKIKRFFKVGSEKQLRQAIRTIHELADKVIQQKRDTCRSSPPSDLLSRFMSTVDDNDNVFLRDIVVSFLLAGRDTVASALTSFFWLLNENPDAIRKILEESDNVIGREPDAAASFEQLKKLNYLHAAVHESMRLFPPIQFDSKFCQNDDVLPDGTFVGRGTRVTYHPYSMGRMAGIWGDDCTEFKPERWLRPCGAFRCENPYRYPVFQAGPRVCLGKEMSIVEMKAVALALIRRFDFNVCGSPGRGLRFVSGLTASVRGGLPVVFRDRRR